MNPLFWPTLGVAVILFWFGTALARITQKPMARNLAWASASAVALPGLLFALYYTHLLGEPLWLYRFRAIPGSELSAAGVGLLAGMLQRARANSPTARRYFSRLGIPFLAAVILCGPYLKQMIRPVRLPDSPNGWSDNICKQSTPSTCGPASAATLARLAGVEVDEFELARDAFTSASGTENWYLARALRSHGLTVEFVKSKPETEPLPYPAIAGVKLSYGTGHFIPVLDVQNSNYTVGDPMTGRETKSFAELCAEYKFTGFFMIVK